MDAFYSLLKRADMVVQRMGMGEWAIVGASLIVVALITMRGYGSRKNY